MQILVLMFLDLVVEGGPGRGIMRGSKSNMNGNIEESVSFVDFLCLQWRDLALCFSDASDSYCSWVLLPFLLASTSNNLCINLDDRILIIGKKEEETRV